MCTRREYEMTEKDLEEILSAGRPTPVIFGNNGMDLGGNQQENTDNAWKRLGKKMGFNYMTVRPIRGKNNTNRFFTAVPSETESQKD